MTETTGTDVLRGALDLLTENNRRARYYRLTAAGRRAVGEEARHWRRYVGAMELVLGPVEGTP